MRTLIIGASGFIGGVLHETFGPGTAGTYFNHPVDGLLPLDIRDAAAVGRLVAEVRPALVVHPAAQPHVDWCEEHTEESYAVNVAGTRNVAAAARAAGARYVFFSTDYVFNGHDGPYREDSTPDPINVYGRHKLAAEQAIAATLDDHLIVRVCGVYGFERAAKNFVMALLGRSRRGETMYVPLDQWGTPTYVEDLAAAVRELATAEHRGVWNVVGAEFLDRVSFARLVCAVFDLDPGFLQPRTTAELGQKAPRPLRGGLVIDKARAVLKSPLRGPREGLEQLKIQLHTAGLLESA
ncbi:NAD(P)-dependent oxidoreductase [Candidatus Binatia bacterium]|nr:NAD(P)-dependent oxidoreductase [Candidatus Binatia bacterium]